MASFINQKHIFFPTDFSKNAAKALRFAAEIARRSGATLSLFHAIEHTMDITPQFDQTKDQLIDKANEKFDRVIADLRKKKRFKNLSVSTILETGQPVDGLLNQAKIHSTGLIVMGTKGATSDRNVLFGSVTTRLIKHSKIPVLAIPQGSTFDQFSHIIFATDYKEGDSKALNKTIQFAKLFDSNIDIVHVERKDNKKTGIQFRGFRDLVTSKVDYSKIDFHLVYENDFFPGMADYLIDHPASLLVMVRYQKTFWEKLLERNHTKEMAFYSDIPVLVFNGSLKHNEHINFEKPEQSDS